MDVPEVGGGMTAEELHAPEVEWATRRRRMGQRQRQRIRQLQDCQDDWHPNNEWRQPAGGEEDNNVADVTSDWDEYIAVRDSTVRVELSGTELGDVDLKSLVRHLDGFLQRYSVRNRGHYALDIDLSC
ncbi:MAG: hypothetical protein ACKPKO_35995, partial [Candidatus Fonsibacter sp.]